MGQQPGRAPAAAVVEAMQLKDGDDIEIITVNAKTLAVDKKPDTEEL